MSAAYVLDAVRTPFGRYGGALAGVRPDDLAAHGRSRRCVERAPRARPGRDRRRACSATPTRAGEDNRNVARMAVLLAGLPTSVPGRDRQPAVRLEPRGGDAGAAARSRPATPTIVRRRRRRVDEPRAVGRCSSPSTRLPRGHETLHSTTLGWRMVNPQMPEQWTISLGESAEKLAEQSTTSRARSRTRSRCAATATRARAWDERLLRRARSCPVPDTELERDETHPRRHVAGEAGQAASPAFARTARSPPATRRRSTTAPARCCSADEDGGATARRRAARADRRRAAAHGVDPDVFGIGPVEAANEALRARRHRLGRRRRSSSSTRRSPSQSLACLRRLARARPRATSTPTAARSRIGHPLGASGVRILGALAHELQAPAAAATAWRRSASASARASPSSWRLDEAQRMSATDPSPDTSREPGRRIRRSTTPDYRSTALRAPKQPLVYAAAEDHRDHRPGARLRRRSASSTTTSRASTTGEPIGERIIVSGRRARRRRASRSATRWSRSGRPTPAGRYRHRGDQLAGAAGPELHRRRALRHRRPRAATAS